MDKFSMDEFSNIMQDFGQANPGDPMLWTAWLILFLFLFLAVKWDARRQRKEEEELQKIHEK